MGKPSLAKDALRRALRVLAAAVALTLSVPSAALAEIPAAASVTEITENTGAEEEKNGAAERSSAEETSAAAEESLPAEETSEAAAESSPAEETSEAAAESSPAEETSEAAAESSPAEETSEAAESSSAEETSAAPEETKEAETDAEGHITDGTVSVDSDRPELFHFYHAGDLTEDAASFFPDEDPDEVIERYEAGEDPDEILDCDGLLIGDLLESDTESDTVYRSETAAAAYLRSQMAERAESVDFTYEVPADGREAWEIIDSVREKALEQTGNGRDGQCLDYVASSGYYMVLKDSDTMEIEEYTTIRYRTTRAEQQELSSEVKLVLEELDLGDKSDFQKTRAIYDYITENVTYDYDGLASADSDSQIYTAYAALIKKKAVCNGYACLFYRLAADAGLKAVYICGYAGTDGDAETVNHAWNAVRLNGKYYQLDSTWDAGNLEDLHYYKYFLKSDDTLEDHVRLDEYAGAAFNGKYPMASEEYPTAYLWFRASEYTVKLGSTVPYRPSGRFFNMMEETAVLTSSDPSVAVIDAQGNVEAAGVGSAVITASLNGAAAQYTLYVVPESTDRAGVTEFVTRLYRNFLLREPEETGLNYWTDLLTGLSISGSQCVEGFIFSREFQEKNMSSEDYISAMYETIFGRAADASGLSYWTGYLDAGCTRKFPMEGFMNSAEMKTYCAKLGIRAGTYASDSILDRNADTTCFVSRMYTKCLARAYDPDGLQYWVECLAAKKTTGTAVARDFFLSDEIIGQGLSDADYLSRAYAAVMGRLPDESGEAYWLGVLADGLSREDMVNSFCGSPEFAGLCGTYGIKQ